MVAHRMTPARLAQPPTVAGVDEVVDQRDDGTDGRLMLLAVLAIAAVVLVRPRLAGTFSSGPAREWMAVFIAVSVQAVPFLVLGVTLSALLASVVSPTALARLLPRNRAAAVVVAGGAGVALPGCECGAVPIAGRLIGGGVPAAAALTFLLAAPAVNPVVMVATATAFPGQPELVAARFAASMATAIIMGLIWIRIGSPALLERLLARYERTGGHEPGSRWDRFSDAAAHDLLHAGGWLVVGAAVAATIQVTVPRSVIDAIADVGPLAILVLGLLAVALAVCSEADAFVATSFTAFSPTARLTFMVVGPAVDIKLIAMQNGVFGPRFTRVFAPLSFVVAVLCATVAGTVLL
jgi:uncharacterized membrane protein YraQ (UPF0718 family)